MINIEKVREALDRALAEEFYDIGTEYNMVNEAITELERLQKREVDNHLFTIAVGYNLALVNNKDITEKQFYEIINKHYEIAITRSDEK